MNWTLHIRNNKTGEVRTMPEEPYKDADEPIAHAGYVWGEGNFGCDCNRALFFAQANNDKDPDIECGTGGFTVWIMDGTDVIYADDDAPSSHSSDGN